MVLVTQYPQLSMIYVEKEDKNSTFWVIIGVILESKVVKLVSISGKSQAGRIQSRGQKNG